MFKKLMNKEIKEKWIKALRSGEYQQGKSVLRDDKNNFCCLGVLCELAVKEGAISEPKMSHDFDDTSCYSYDKEFEVLPPEVQEWSGITSNKGVYGIYAYENLADLNDSGSTFEEIANIIEERF